MVEKLSRRNFLKAAVTGAGLAALFTSPITLSKAEETVNSYNKKPKAMLIDVRKCIGCKACQVACKVWNKLPAEETAITEDEYTNPTSFSANTWCYVKFSEVKDEAGNVSWRMASVRCMHCLEPTCVSVCPTKALKKLPEGPVIYDPNRCIGCKYCVEACPWHVPHFDEERKVIGKCIFCVDRIKEGMVPACVANCQTGALQFGDRDEILEKAHNSGAQYIYGEKEAGGTSMIFVSDVPFEKLGFPKVPHEPISTYKTDLLKSISGIGVATFIISLVGYFGVKMLVKRKAQVKASSKGV
ncbi:4Fe-4S dicluster domain-containing protein [Candidatus Bathyarchaeota archaeon]|nr:MAG: 4Fe-4S dicluster domain-containing protein [Candidatus Bathyarchaeota archaeon]